MLLKNTNNLPPHGQQLQQLVVLEKIIFSSMVQLKIDEWFSNVKICGFSQSYIKVILILFRFRVSVRQDKQDI